VLTRYRHSSIAALEQAVFGFIPYYYHTISMSKIMPWRILQMTSMVESQHPIMKVTTNADHNYRESKI
jgi:hypothetical protein